MASVLSAVRVVVKGRVQGVCYRWWTVEQARHRGLTGWVRNRKNGDVEAVFCGSSAVVDEMIEACKRGPPAASVTEVQRFDDVDEAGGFSAFSQWLTV